MTSMTIYKILDTKYDDSDALFEIKDNNGILEYNVRFYNGGCGLIEALDICLEKL